jgi:predicted nucleic acid-binding protein
MTAAFADTHYYLALLSKSDIDHDKAAQLSRAIIGQTVTTAWVLVEVADALAGPAYRPLFLALHERLSQNSRVTIIPPSIEWFERGIALYAKRLDKAWSLTDCISFAVMQEMRLTEALTGDHHFEHSGFHALLA